MARIRFEVTSNAVQEDLLVLTRDGRPLQLRLVDGRASAELPEGGYDLFWSLRGPPGAPFAVVARQGETVLLETFDAIPARNLRHAGGAYFSVKGREAPRAARDGAELFMAGLRRPATSGVTAVTARLRAAGPASGDFAPAE